MRSRRFLGLELTAGLLTLLVLATLGLGLIVYRFFFGLGAVTNLSDGYPWGFWIGIDILVGIALASGGFVMAGLVHVFGGTRFHRLARPAILTALLGYLLFILALCVDLGRPWHIWIALVSWNHLSPMFEVAWCVMFYTFVLFLEFMPAVLERFRLTRALRAWRRLAPWAVVAALTLFVYAMSDSAAWAALTLTVLLSWELLMRGGAMPRDAQMPLLLIIAGIMLSTLHQSSLGTLFLITDRLSSLWYTPILPILFFLSAIMVAPAMVIVEAMVSGRVLGHQPELALLDPLGRAVPVLAGAYLAVRLGDALIRGVIWVALTPSLQSLWLWLEIGLLVVAVAQFVDWQVRERPAGLFGAALATVLGLIVHRTGVALVGISVPQYARYIPAWSEIMITLGVFAIGLLAFRLAVEHLPVYEAERVESARATPAPASQAGNRWQEKRPAA